MDNFVDEEDHWRVRPKLNELALKGSEVSKDAAELAVATKKTAESGQDFVNTFEELFLKDAATYVQAGAIAFAALTLATV